MSTREKIENRMMQLLLVLITLTLFSFWMLGNMYAKYVTKSEGTDSARVAAFVIEDTNNLKQTYELNPSMTGTDEQKVQVTIKNSSEVAVRYTFSFITDGNLPIQIAGNRKSNGSNDENSDGNSNGSETSIGGSAATKGTDGVNANTWTVEKTAGTSWDETYTFTLSIENTNESYQYAGGVESIQLTVKAEQID